MTDERQPHLLKPSPPPRILSSEQQVRYRIAIAALQSSELGRDPQAFAAALDLAMYHSEKARRFGWPEDGVRAKRREVSETWDVVNKAAVKLAIHFEKLEDQVGLARIDAAVLWSGMKLKAPRRERLHLSFAAFLRALAKQSAPTETTDRAGPMRMQQPIRKLPSREVVLTIILAYSFDYVAGHRGAPFQLPIGGLITSGKEWNVAALFASAALGEDDLDPKAAKKYLSVHETTLYYEGWPEPDFL